MAVNVPLNEHGVTQQEETFAHAFIKLGQKTLAMKAAYDCSNYKPQSIGRAALKVYQRPRVQARIAQLKSQMTAELVAHQVQQQEPTRQLIYGALQVFQHWQDIALADPQEIVTVRRICCRWCHGKGHHYQWRDEIEFAEATAKVIDENAIRQKMRPQPKPEPLPTDEGGYGFRFNEQPHKDCPRCLGEGTPDVLLKDLTLLDARHRRLFKSLEVKKDGSIKVHLHDQAAALTNMAKALGMLVEKVKFVDPADKTGELPALPLDPVQASRAYAEMLKGS